MGDATWWQALHSTIQTYGDPIEQEKFERHAVKAAGKLGVPGSKGIRTAAFKQFIEEARAQGFVTMSDGMYTLNPAVSAPADNAAHPTEASLGGDDHLAYVQQHHMAEPSLMATLQAPLADAPLESAPAEAPAVDFTAAAAVPDSDEPPAKRHATATSAATAASRRGTLSDIAAIASTELGATPQAAAATQQQQAHHLSHEIGMPPAVMPGTDALAAVQEAAGPSNMMMHEPAVLHDPNVLAAAAAPMPAAAAPTASVAAAAPAAVAPKKKIGRPRQENSWKLDRQRTDVKRGKFTTDEKETLKKAVREYALGHGHDPDNLEWLFKTRQTPGVYSASTGGAWQQIAQSLPHRTTQQVWACGTRMLNPLNYKGKWTAEEDEQLRALVAEKGNHWLEIGRTLGRMGEACRDRWRTIHQGEKRNTGTWSEEEQAKLNEAVREYMENKQAARAAQQANGAAAADKRVVLDDVDWGTVAKKVGTRNHAQCMERWYKCQAPSMEQRGQWGGPDEDLQLLLALEACGATQEWEVDWGNMVPNRNADAAQRRWMNMVKQVESYNDKEFLERLTWLLDRQRNPQPAKQSAAAAATIDVDNKPRDVVAAVMPDGTLVQPTLI